MSRPQITSYTRKSNAAMSSRHVARETNTVAAERHVSHSPTCLEFSKVSVRGRDRRKKVRVRQSGPRLRENTQLSYCANFPVARLLRVLPLFQVLNEEKKKVPGIVSTSTRGTSFCSPRSRRAGPLSHRFCLMMGLGADLPAGTTRK